MPPLLGRAARRQGSCCGHDRDCDDWSAAHKDWPETRRQQRQAEKRAWRLQEDVSGRGMNTREEQAA
jgi:hypothetical protein